MCSSDLEEDGDDQFDIDESDDEDELEDALHVVTSLEDHDTMTHIMMTTMVMAMVMVMVMSMKGYGRRNRGFTCHVSY